MSLKLSTRCRYGVYALFDLAYHSGGEAVQSKDMARRQHIPQRYLEQILAALRRAGIVESKRGPAGGYVLARAPEEISVGDVLRATEGQVKLVDGVGPLGPNATHTETCGAAPTCLWNELSSRIIAAFDGVTIAHFCERGRALGIHRAADVSGELALH